MHVARRIRSLIVGLFFVAAGTAAANATEGPRVALLIGNSAYEQSILRNPVNDVALLRDQLSELGFQVMIVEDGTERDMERAIVDFAVALQDAGREAVGLFYYSGHGVQSNGENYLIPIGARIERQADLGAEAIRANWVLEQLDAAGNSVNFLLFDACRNNPLPRSMFRASGTGLSEMNAPLGTFIGYSTAPGTVASDGRGDNSPYAEALVEEITAPGVPAEVIFRRVRQRVLDTTNGTQTPWDASSLTGDDFYFATTTTTTTTGPSGDVSTTTTTEAVRVLTPGAIDEIPVLVGGDRIELAFWETISDSDNAADYEAYLDRYPDGAFSTLAEIRLASLNPTAPVAPEITTEPARTGDEIIVDASGAGDYRTIQEAVDAVLNGGVILVRPGVYVEDVSMQREVQFTLRGMGSGSERPRIQGATYRPLYITAGQPTIENFILVGDLEEYAAVWIPGGRPRLNNNEIRAAVNSCVYVQGIAAPTLQGNTIGPCGYHAMFVGESASGIYQDNDVRNTGATAIFVQDSATPSLVSNRVRPGSSESRGLEVFDTASPNVFDNIFEGGLRGIVVGGNASGRYERNAVSSTSDQAFLAYENSAPEVVDNRFSDTESHCIHIKDQATGRFERNTLLRCGSSVGSDSFAPLTITEEASPLVVDNVISQPGHPRIDNRSPLVDVSMNEIRE